MGFRGGQPHSWDATRAGARRKVAEAKRAEDCSTLRCSMRSAVSTQSAGKGQGGQVGRGVGEV